MIKHHSLYDGVINAVLFTQDQIVDIGNILYTIDIDDAKYPLKGKKKVETEETRAKPGVLVSPACRVLVNKHSINTSLVTGTGKRGRITKSDLIHFLEGPPSSLKESSTVQLNIIQKSMSRAMTKALDAPHLTFSEDVYLDNLISLRNTLKETAKLTFLPFFMKGLSMAILDFPIMNSVYLPQRNGYVLKEAHNIGFAMDSPIGLIVPNVKNCESKSVFEIAQELSRIRELGSVNQITEHDVSAGTITISNVGAIGGTYGRPVLFAPQSVIGALGTARSRLERVNGEIATRQVMGTSWSADHRVIDGATTARFVMRWKELIENPSLFLLKGI